MCKYNKLVLACVCLRTRRIVALHSFFKCLSKIEHVAKILHHTLISCKCFLHIGKSVTMSSESDRHYARHATDGIYFASNGYLTATTNMIFGNTA